MAEQTEAVIALMRKTIADKDGQIKQLQQTIEQLQATVANLTETIEESRRKFFGSSSEKTGRQETGEEKEAGKITVSSYTRERKPKSKREDIYKNLPAVEVRCPVPEGQRLCPDCDTPMKTVTYEFVREVLNITPAKVERVRYYQEVLACPVCREEDEGTFVKASVPTALLAHSLASPSIVAHVMYQKFMNAVPFYRQELDWLQMGAPLARETTSNWCIKCALAYFQPVYDMLHAYLLKREILHADETVCQVLHEKDKAAASKSYMWIYLSGNDGLAPIILYEYQPGRQGEYAKNFLEGFTGILECDGYTGYNSVENVILACCLAHCRRYFFEAIPAARRKKNETAGCPFPGRYPKRLCRSRESKGGKEDSC